MLFRSVQPFFRFTGDGLGGAGSMVVATFSDWWKDETAHRAMIWTDLRTAKRIMNSIRKMNKSNRTLSLKKGLNIMAKGMMMNSNKRIISSGYKKKPTPIIKIKIQHVYLIYHSKEEGRLVRRVSMILHLLVRLGAVSVSLRIFHLGFLIIFPELNGKMVGFKVNRPDLFRK